MICQETAFKELKSNIGNLQQYVGTVVNIC